MKKITGLMLTLVFLSGCVESLALLGPISGSGNMAQSALSSSVSYGVKKQTGKSPSEHVMEYVKKNNPEAELFLVECDLQSFESVRKAAKEVVKLCHKGLDALCNNAGVMALKDIATSDGFDVQMQTNHLSHFLLTKKFIEKSWSFK